MRLAAAVFVTILMLAMVRWVLTDAPIHHLADLLPFVGGHEPGLYDWAGLMVIAITASGIARMLRPPDDDD